MGNFKICVLKELWITTVENSCILLFLVVLICEINLQAASFTACNCQILIFCWNIDVTICVLHLHVDKLIFWQSCFNFPISWLEVNCGTKNSCEVSMSTISSNADISTKYQRVAAEYAKVIPCFFIYWKM